MMILLKLLVQIIFLFKIIKILFWTNNTRNCSNGTYSTTQNYSFVFNQNLIHCLGVNLGNVKKLKACGHLDIKLYRKISIRHMKILWDKNWIIAHKTEIWTSTWIVLGFVLLMSSHLYFEYLSIVVGVDQLALGSRNDLRKANWSTSTSIENHH